MQIVALNLRFQNSFNIRIDVFCAYTGKVLKPIYGTLKIE